MNTYLQRVYADRADWTLLEYAAIRILSQDNPLAAIYAYWDDTYSKRIVLETANGIDDDNGPCRFTDQGVVWLAELAERVQSLDDRVTIAAAREFIKSMGTLAVSGIARGMQ